jgi:hypothetical protein
MNCSGDAAGMRAQLLVRIVVLHPPLFHNVIRCHRTTCVGSRRAEVPVSCTRHPHLHTAAHRRMLTLGLTQGIVGAVLLSPAAK